MYCVQWIVGTRGVEVEAEAEAEAVEGFLFPLETKAEKIKDFPKIFYMLQIISNYTHYEQVKMG